MWRDCKAWFRSHPTGGCPYCGRNIKHDMARHVSSFHLDFGQLWRCPVSWCTQWKGTPQDCIDHVHQKHNVGDSVKTAILGKWLPPWTATRAVWHTALKPKVSGVSTDAALFSEQGAELVHHYRVFGDCAAHASLRGSFMVDLLYFTTRACVDAHWAAKHSRSSGPGPACRQINQFCCLRMSSNIHRTTVRKAPQDESPVVADESSPTDISAVISAGELEYGTPQVPLMHSALFGWQQPILQYRYTYHSPRSLSLRISGIHLRSRLRNIRHGPGPGRRPLVWI